MKKIFFFLVFLSSLSLRSDAAAELPRTRKATLLTVFCSAVTGVIASKQFKQADYHSCVVTASAFSVVNHLATPAIINRSVAKDFNYQECQVQKNIASNMRWYARIGNYTGAGLGFLTGFLFS